MPTVLVIGVGNPLRRDDGVGPAIVERFERQSVAGVRTLIVHQLTPELAWDVSQATGVVFVDASVEGTPGAIRVSPTVDASGSRPLSHRVAPAEILALSASCFGSAPTAVALTVTGVDFELGEGLSAAVESAVADAVLELARLVERWTADAPPLPTSG